MLDLQENISKKVKKTSGRHVVDFEDLSIDVLLEIPNHRYS